MKILRYCPELNQLTGGVNSTLLMVQLEYWFEKTSDKTFFKFLEPCEDMHYKSGDSWCEELGFSKAEFRTAFSKIGKVYKSKKEFNESKDKFEGKLYLSYFDRIRRLTFYMRNTELVDQQMKNFNIDQQEEAPYEEITEMYHEICEELPKKKFVSRSLKDRMNEIWQWVKGDYERIRSAFEKVKNSDFLNGRLEGKSWQANLDWVMQKDKFVDILGDRYANQERKRNESQRGNKRFNKIASHNWDFNLLEALEQEYIAKLPSSRGLEGLEKAVAGSRSSD